MHVVVQNSPAYQKLQADDWEPFAVALIPAPRGLAVPNGQVALGDVVVMVSMRRHFEQPPGCGCYEDQEVYCEAHRG